MKLTLASTVYAKNGARVEDSAGCASLSRDTERALRELAREYRISPAEMAVAALTYYFGDGKNHLGCEYCAWDAVSGCKYPKQGEQTTIPSLDKGIVVVGLSTSDQVF